MIKIRIAVVSGLVAALLAATVAHAATEPKPVRHLAGPVLCCFTADMGQN